jgi:hypothetical protein
MLERDRILVAVGDPQTHTEKFKRLLRHHALLGDDGMLAPEVHLVVLGDYFDFGDHESRKASAAEGLETLRWLSTHSHEQVTLIAGNHDLARIGEFATMTDERFTHAVERAAETYGHGHAPVSERTFLDEFPEFPSAEAAARDFSSFIVEQRQLVLRLLEEKRLRLAATLGDLVFCHAGVTIDDLAALGGNSETPEDIVGALNRALDEAFASWDCQTPFEIPHLHTPGSAVVGEGGGILFHRAAKPSEQADGYTGVHRRRYDPRRLPRGIVQVLGHVRDRKSRSLLGSWVTGPAPAKEGRIRGLVTDGVSARYSLGFPRTGADLGSLVFVDGGMHHSEVEDYELLDVLGRRAFRAAAPAK